MGLGKIAKKVKSTLSKKGSKSKKASKDKSKKGKTAKKEATKRERRDAGLPAQLDPKKGRRNADLALKKGKTADPKRRNADLAKLRKKPNAPKDDKTTEPEQSIPLHGYKGKPVGNEVAPEPEKAEVETRAPTDEKKSEPVAKKGQPVGYDIPIFHERVVDDSESSSTASSADADDEKVEKKDEKPEDSESTTNTATDTTTSSTAEFSEVEFKQSKVEEGPSQDANQYEAAKNVSVEQSSSSRTTASDSDASKGSQSDSSSGSDIDPAEEKKKDDQKARLGALGPNVQKATKRHGDFDVAMMQQTLRGKAERRGTDTHGEHDNAIVRDAKSANERDSEGWATLTIKSGYRNTKAWSATHKGDDDNKKSDIAGISGQATEYYLSRTMKLEQWTQDLFARNLMEGHGKKREDTVLRYENGQFYHADSDTVVDTTDLKITNQSIHKLGKDLQVKKAFHANVPDKLARLEAKVEKFRALIKAQSENADNVSELKAAAGLAGRYIFVMNASGKLFAGESQVGIVHHSSFLAGGAVACAGEIEIAGGKLKLVSNASGHYMPGPAFMWQALEQMRSNGVDLAGVKVEIVGVSSKFQALEFLRIVNPQEDFYWGYEHHSWFEMGPAVKYLDELARGRSRERNPLPQKASEGAVLRASGDMGYN